MALDLELGVDGFSCFIGDHRLVCNGRQLTIGRQRWPLASVLDLRVSPRLFFVEVTSTTGTHRYYASPRPWEGSDWERLRTQLLRCHHDARHGGDDRDVPAELLQLRRLASA